MAFLDGYNNSSSTTAVQEPCPKQTNFSENLWLNDNVLESWSIRATPYSPGTWASASTSEEDLQNKTSSSSSVDEQEELLDSTKPQHSIASPICFTSFEEALITNDHTICKQTLRMNMLIGDNQNPTHHLGHEGTISQKIHSQWQDNLQIPNIKESISPPQLPFVICTANVGGVISEQFMGKSQEEEKMPQLVKQEVSIRQQVQPNQKAYNFCYTTAPKIMQTIGFGASASNSQMQNMFMLQQHPHVMVREEGVQLLAREARNTHWRTLDDMQEWFALPYKFFFKLTIPQALLQASKSAGDFQQPQATVEFQLVRENDGVVIEDGLEVKLKSDLVSINDECVQKYMANFKACSYFHSKSAFYVKVLCKTATSSNVLYTSQAKMIYCRKQLQKPKRFNKKKKRSREQKLDKDDLNL